MVLKLNALLFLFAAAFASPATAANDSTLNPTLNPTLNGVFIDAADGNRFFTRVGGIAHDQLVYDNLTPGGEYSLESRLVVVGSGEKSDVVVTNFTAGAQSGNVTVVFPIAANKTDFNIDYVSDHVLFQIVNGVKTEILIFNGDHQDPKRTIQVHSIQRIKITSVADAHDADLKLDGDGGEIIVKLRYENLVEAYRYTIWGQLLTPSGQAVGIFASIPEYAPIRKAGPLMLIFSVPKGFEGLSLTPSVGIYHYSRVTISQNGVLNWKENAPNPVMIASETNLNNRNKTVEIGVPFGGTTEVSIPFRQDHLN